eukprot:GGOE01046706.1.p1 GENE.GGOE01046706.1~~GGOE01046706.1.p1  ORF type:complete len:451 (+),score=110.56 GGOE01046706.1:61-1413(+)
MFATGRPDKRDCLSCQTRVQAPHRLASLVACSLILGILWITPTATPESGPPISAADPQSHAPPVWPPPTPTTLPDSTMPPTTASRASTVTSESPGAAASKPDDTARWVTVSGRNRKHHVNRSQPTCLSDGCGRTPFMCNRKGLLPRLPKEDECKSYVTTQPDAQGLGHAHANRDTALLVALELAPVGLCYAHPPIKARHVHDQKVWDHWLGFEEGWKGFTEVMRNPKLEHIQLPALQPYEEIVASIRRGFRPNALYILPFHQDAFDHCPTASIWRHLYDERRAKEKPPTPFMNVKHHNVVIHLRRGDVQNSIGANRRIKPIGYFQHLLRRVLWMMNRTATRPIDTHVVSLGFPNFEKALWRDFPGAQTHMNTAPAVTLHSFVLADVLITSESKFSHLAAMLSRNIKFAVSPFQYAVDCDDWWVQTDAEGRFDEQQFMRLWEWLQHHHHQP